MKQTKLYTLLTILLALIAVESAAQKIKGTVTDATTGTPIPYISVYYEGSGTGAITDDNGCYEIESRAEWNELTFSAIGYRTHIEKIRGGKNLKINVALIPDDILLEQITIKPEKKRYRRKNNPAVELMRQVIKNKKHNSPEAMDFYHYDKYRRITTSLNDFTPELLDKGIYKKMPFIQRHLDICDETAKLILPVTIDETVSKVYYRKKPAVRKEIITGEKSEGLNKLFATGEVISTKLKDIFTDVNLYNDNIWLLNNRFISPVSSTNAIQFYRYFIMDTVSVAGDSCIHLSFVPNNSRDVGFTGHLYIKNDSTRAIKRCKLQLPKKSTINYVDNMIIDQQFTTLPDGGTAIKKDEMIVELSLVDFMQGAMARRTTVYSNYSFAPLPDSIFSSRHTIERGARKRDKTFWAKNTAVEKTYGEESMSTLVNEMTGIKNFNFIHIMSQMILESFVEAGPRDNNKFDIGPVNTFLSHNHIDGIRMRVGGRTTANLNPRLFFNGFAAYGTKDHRPKYMIETEYSFHDKQYMPKEFPRHSLRLKYRDDVMSPTDKFLKTDKDNMFVSFKTSPVDQMMYFRDLSIDYNIETNSRLSITAGISRTVDKPTGILEYITLDNRKINKFRLGQATVALRYAPGETYINTKQNRFAVNSESPVFTLSHTVGIKGFMGGQHKFNRTEASFNKRIWMPYAMGDLDLCIKAGAEWNTVPFPLLLMPEANLSYVREKHMFNMMTNMEFLNDRYLQFDIDWDMKGKILNRIPLLRKLGWREVFTFKMLKGTLTNKNNPQLNNASTELYHFPRRNGQPTSFIMGHTPYMEVSAGIHNIFKILHIEYVRRLNYLNNPGVKKNGVRFMARMSF